MALQHKRLESMRASMAEPFLAGLPVVVRTYPGRTQADAASAFALQAAVAASHGYRPVSQSWADGRAGIGRVLALGVFADTMRPDGVLTVTYVAQDAPVVPQAPTDTKVCPDCGEQVKQAARVCRYCRFEFAAIPEG